MRKKRKFLHRNRRHLLKTFETFSARSPSAFEIPSTLSSAPVSETSTDQSTTLQLTPDTPVSISATMNDADQSQGPLTSTGYTPRSGVLSSHYQNTRTLLIIKVLQDLIICMETETV